MTLRSTLRRVSSRLLQVVESPGVDIIIPVFNAREHVQRCLSSVRRHAPPSARILVVDDASTDATLVEWLENQVKDWPAMRLERQPSNRGFVQSANFGMAAATGRDVILLNSDTIVPRRFVERLRDCVYSDRQTGIASPLTNNGSICAVPEFLAENEIPAELGVDGCAELISRISRKRHPEIVTAVGFCMYVRASVLARIGLFDAEHFGRGYGEENDFCERAKQAGFRIRLCDDLFVAHAGRASFGSSAGEAFEHSHNEIMAKLHPTYHDEVRRFITTNPLAEIQAEVRRAFATGRATG